MQHYDAVAVVRGVRGDAQDVFSGDRGIAVDFPFPVFGEGDLPQ